MNTNRSSYLNKVEGLDSFEIAQQVIHSLRATRMNKKNYQQLEDNLQGIGIQELNTLIQKEKVHYEEYNKNKIKVESMLDQSLQAPSIHSVDSSILSDYEEKPRYQPPPLLSSQVDDFDEDSDDELDSQQKQQIMKANHQSYQGHLKPTASKPTHAADDFFDVDDDDDEGLFSSDFIPPSKGNRSSESSVNKAPSKFSSKSDVAVSALKKGIIIKPGQAIRVNSKGLKKTTTS